MEKGFDSRTTLEELQREMRKMYSIGNDRETKLWINSQTYAFKPSNTTSSGAVTVTNENNGNSKCINNSADSTNGGVSPSKSANNLHQASSTTSPIKPPPTPPPMPSPSASTAPLTSISSSSPNVLTRQAANSMAAAAASNSLNVIALHDSTTSSTTSTNEKESSPTQTLAEAGVGQTAVVTLEVINADGTWPSSRPRFGTVSTRSQKAQPGLCGLSNMGNTCFMNAALQCLSNTPPLTNYILADKFIDDINTSNPIGRHGEIARTYADLIKVMWGGNNTSFLPREFKCAVSRFAPQFTGFSQQDCQELMAFLLDGLHEDLNRIRDKPYIEVKNEVEQRPDEVVAAESWANYKKRNDSIVVDTFHSMLKSTLVCPGCKLVSVTFDPFCYLSLPLPVKREKQVNLTFLPKPNKLDTGKIELALSKLDPEERDTILKYGGSLSSFDGTIEESAGYNSPQARCPKSCKMQVPRSGPASEICDIVARIINEERPDEMEKVDPNQLVVAELTIGKISKVYESSEHYNQISDDIVVIEKASNYVIPLYLRERKPNNTIYVNGQPMFLHVADLKFDTLYKSIISSLSNLTCDEASDIVNWKKIAVPTEDPATKNKTDDTNMRVDYEGECEIGSDEPGSNNGNCTANTTLTADSTTGAADEIEMELDTVKTNGKSPDKKDGENEEPASSSCDGKSSGGGAGDDVVSAKTAVAFDLCLVNSFGNHTIEKLGPRSRECDYTSKLYLGATFSPEILATPQFEHLVGPSKGSNVEIFTPKISPKPTLQLKDCITQFTNVERLGAEDPWYCPKCKKHQQATKKFDIWSLPKVLIIHLKRFSFSRSWRDKIDTLVEFPVEDLDMSQYVLNPAQKQPGKAVYSLIGVANHYGGLGGGHYTAYAKNHLQNAWYSFDDALVTQTSSSNVVTRSAYVLFYQLKEDQADSHGQVGA